MSVFDGPRDRTPRHVGDDPPHDLAARVRVLEDWRIVVAGPNADNGKLGQLRKDFDKDVASRGSFTKWIAGVAVTAMLTAFGSAWTVARGDGAEERTIEYLRDEAAVMRGVIDRITAEVATLRLALATLRAQVHMPRRRDDRDGDKP